MDDVRDVLPVLLLGRRLQHTLRVRARLGDGSDEVQRRAGRRRGPRLAVERGVQDQDLVPDLRVREGGADALQHQGGHDGGVQRADAVDDRLGRVQRGEDGGVGREPDLLAEGVDVPQALDPSRQFLLVGFGEGDVLLAQGGEGAGEVCVFDAVVVFDLVQGGGRGGEGGVQGGGVRGVGDGVLACDGGAVGQADGDVVREACVDGREDRGVAGD